MAVGYAAETPVMVASRDFVLYALTKLSQCQGIAIAQSPDLGAVKVAFAHKPRAVLYAFGVGFGGAG